MDIFFKFAHATFTTVQIALAAGALAWVVSFVAGLSKLSPYRLVSWPVVGMVELVRGTSCYVQLFWLYFVLPMLGVEISAMTAGILAIGLNIGCYGSEVVRSAILAVPRGLLETARALNMNAVQTMFNVVLPNAFPRMVPPMCNLMVDLLKITPLVSLVTIADLTFLGQIYRQETGSPLLAFGILMVIYFVLSSLIVHAFRRVEHWAGKGFEGTRSF